MINTVSPKPSAQRLSPQERTDAIIAMTGQPSGRCAYCRDRVTADNLASWNADGTLTCTACANQEQDT